MDYFGKSASADPFNNMTSDTICISSDEDVPLNSLESLHSNSSATDHLKTHCLNQCEFCDDVFFNRYTALIHNARHIIVPLLKQNVYQCMECLYYFTSQIELKHHEETKHKKEIPNSNNESDINDKMEKLHMAISDIVKKELDVKLEDYIIQNKLKSPVKVKEDLHVKEELEEENYVHDTVDENLRNHVSELKISNRLQFEDDLDVNDDTVLENNVCIMGGNGLLNDLTTVCKVNLNLFDKPWVEDEKDINIETSESNVNNGVIIDAPKVENIEPSIVEYTPSTHYEDLIRPGMYRCKRCINSFPTRFQLIQHEMSHMKMRKARPLLCIHCERFISNTRAVLKKHIDEQHRNERTARPKQLPNCTKCGLRYYSYTRHTKNYHVAIPSEREWMMRQITSCHWCVQMFYSEEEKVAHINTKHLVEKKCQHCGMVSTAIEIQEHQKTCKRPVILENFDELAETLCHSAMLKLCETCCLFLKNKNNMQYAIVKSISEMGNRLDCERCGKKYFELKLVRRTTIQKKKDRFGEKERKKHLSNSARLKNIRQRLKMINKLSRC